MNRPDVEVFIRRVVLHGLPVRDGARMGRALERELARLFLQRGAPPSLTRGGAVPAVDGGAFEVAPGGKAEAMGAQVARAIYRGLSR